MKDLVTTLTGIFTLVSVAYHVYSTKTISSEGMAAASAGVGLIAAHDANWLTNLMKNSDAQEGPLNPNPTYQVYQKPTGEYKS